jgi:tRNA nucleotidyltransferase (CCA-adding enzyme)
MKIYLVGGAVRDSLLGLPVVDRDWVVVGATPEKMTAQGFLPVGKDFPVFLHPRTHEEYALARTERKTAPGYRGFVIHADPQVTLEQDLARRDLTINSIASYACCSDVSGIFDSETVLDPLVEGNLIDPFGGQQDLTARLLRHVTEAFREDPVRILRVARFAARFSDFSVAPETMQLMRDMVASGEVDHLVSERVWGEISKGLMAGKPSRMFDVLIECGAFERLFSGLVWGPEAASILDLGARLDAPLPVRFSCLTVACTHPAAAKELGSDPNLLPPALTRVPTPCRDLAAATVREAGHIHTAAALDAPALVTLLTRCDAFRKPERFADLLLACECLWRGRLGKQESAYPARAHLLAVLKMAQSVATNSVAGSAHSVGVTGQKVGEMIHAARVEAVAHGQDKINTKSTGRPV